MLSTCQSKTKHPTYPSPFPFRFAAFLLLRPWPREARSHPPPSQACCGGGDAAVQHRGREGLEPPAPSGGCGGPPRVGGDGGRLPWRREGGSAPPALAPASCRASLILVRIPHLATHPTSQGGGCHSSCPGPCPRARPQAKSWWRRVQRAVTRPKPRLKSEPGWNSWCKRRKGAMYKRGSEGCKACPSQAELSM